MFKHQLGRTQNRNTTWILEYRYLEHIEFSTVEGADAKSVNNAIRNLANYERYNENSRATIGGSLMLPRDRLLSRNDLVNAVSFSRNKSDRDVQLASASTFIYLWEDYKEHPIFQTAIFNPRKCSLSPFNSTKVFGT